MTLIVVQQGQGKCGVEILSWEFVVEDGILACESRERKQRERGKQRGREWEDGLVV